MAFGSDGAVVIDTKLDRSGLESGINSLQATTVNALKKVKSTLTTLGIGVGVVATVKSINSLITSTRAMADRIDDNSQKLGISRQAYQEWDFILQQSGTTIDGLQMGIKTLSDAATAAVAGNKTYSDTFKKLGVSVTDVNGNMKDQETLFNEVFAALSNVENRTERTALANDLLGRSAMELAPAMNSGAAGVEALRSKAHELGIVLDDEVITANNTLSDEIERLQAVLQATAVKALAPFVGKLTEAATAMQGFVNKLFDSNTNIEELFDGIMDSFQGFVNDKLTPFLTEVANLIPQAIALVIGKIAEYGPALVASGVNIVANFAAGIINNLPALITSVVQAVLKIPQGLIDNADTFVAAGRTLLGSIWNGILENATAFATNVGIVFGTIITMWDAIEWKSLGIDLLHKMWDGMKATWNWLWDKVSGLFTSLWDAIKSGFTKGKQIGEEAGEMIVGGISGALESDKPIDSVNKLLSAVVAVGKTANVGKMGEDMASAISNGLLDGMPFFESATEQLVALGIIDPLKLTLPDAKATGVSIGKAIVTGISAGTSGTSSASASGDTFSGFAAAWKKAVDEMKKETKSWDDFVKNKLKSLPTAFTSAISSGVQALGDFFATQKETIADLESQITDMNDSLYDAQETLTEAQEEYNDAVLSGDEKAIKNAKKKIADQEDIIEGYQAQKKALEDQKKSVESGEEGLKSFAKTILSTLADSLYGLGAELLARAAVAAVTFNWAGAATATAGSVAAFAAGVALDSWAGSYADGGIIPGSSYSGDLLTANVNSGELILNAAQQDRIANQLIAAAKLAEVVTNNTSYGGNTVIIQGDVYGMDSDDVAIKIANRISGLKRERIIR